MRFMNEWDICEAEGRFRLHPVLGPATRFLREFAEEVNAHSDGWSYWGPPVRAAGQLISLIPQGYHEDPAPINRRDVEKAIRPIKAFYTRYAKGQYGSVGGRMKLPTLDWTVQQELYL